MEHIFLSFFAIFEEKHYICKKYFINPLKISYDYEEIYVNDCCSFLHVLSCLFKWPNW